MICSRPSLYRGLPNGLKERSDPIFVFHCYAAFSPRLALPPPLVPFFNLSHHFYTPCLPFILEGAISFPFLYIFSYLPVNDTPGASLFKVMITIFCSLLPRFNLNRLSETKVKLYLFYSTLFDLILYIIVYMYALYFSVPLYTYRHISIN